MLFRFAPPFPLLLPGTADDGVWWAFRSVWPMEVEGPRWESAELEPATTELGEPRAEGEKLAWVSVMGVMPFWVRYRRSLTWFSSWSIFGVVVSLAFSALSSPSRVHDDVGRNRSIVWFHGVNLFGATERTGALGIMRVGWLVGDFRCREGLEGTTGPLGHWQTNRATQVLQAVPPLCP